MRKLTLYTGKSGFDLASRKSNFWATDFECGDDYKFTIDEEDVEEIASDLFEVHSFDSIEFEKDEVKHGN